MNLKAVLEGLLFLAGNDGLTFDQIKEILDVDDKKGKELIAKLYQDYQANDRGLQLELLGGAFKLTTKKEHKEYYEKMLSNEVNAELSEAALETLAIIAYNQPITRNQVDEIRGVSSTHIIRKLLIKDLIQDCGKSNLPGRPILYSTTAHFLDYFGLSNLQELPSIEKKETKEQEEDLFKTKYQEKDTKNEEK